MATGSVQSSPVEKGRLICRRFPKRQLTVGQALELNSKLPLKLDMLAWCAVDGLIVRRIGGRKSTQKTAATARESIAADASLAGPGGRRKHEHVLE